VPRARKSIELDETGRQVVLDLLERRRASLDQGLWQAPALTFTAQAFLLQVLTNDDVNWGARLSILIAGLVATVAAVFSLIRGRAREVLYADALASYLSGAGLPGTRPGELPRKPLKREGKLHGWDKSIQAWSETWTIPTYFFWVVALLLFALADVFALVLNL
jgi:hypothetical protein